jgi:1-deoxy-D-xylulose-5-phosphate reductoisomerase
MRLPIQYAFSYPERWAASVAGLDLVRAGRLDFHAPDNEAFPCLALAYRALDDERGLPIVLNAANEVAVAEFLEGRIGFAAIPRVIDGAMRAYRAAPVTTLAAIRQIDTWARQYAQEIARAVELKI